MTWRVSYDALNALAAEQWDLRWRIEWSRRHYKGVVRWAGHSAARTTMPDGAVVDRRHHIRFPGNVPARFALECIAHELEHAAQCERVGMFTFEHLYLTDQAGYEKMAGKAEHRWRELLPAVKGAP